MEVCVHNGQFQNLTTDQREKLLKEANEAKRPRDEGSFVPSGKMTGQNADLDRIRSAIRLAPAQYRNQYMSALEGNASPMKAIKAKCIECNGFEDVISSIKTCRVFVCPLWHHRPYQD